MKLKHLALLSASCLAMLSAQAQTTYQSNYKISFGNFVYINDAEGACKQYIYELNTYQSNNGYYNYDYVDHARPFAPRWNYCSIELTYPNNQTVYWSQQGNIEFFCSNKDAKLIYLPQEQEYVCTLP